jgi:hypothetical protein
MIIRIAPIILILVFGACKKDKTVYSLQYEVWVQSANQSEFSLRYLDAAQATVTTGLIDTNIWKSAVYRDVPKGFEAEIEVVPEGPISDRISLDVRILKNESVVDKNEIRSYSDEMLLRTTL